MTGSYRPADQTATDRPRELRRRILAVPTTHRRVTRFCFSPTEDYQRAVESLRKLNDEDAHRAAAEALSPRAADWLAYYLGSRVGAAIDPARRAGGRRCTYKTELRGHGCRPPGCDHANLWRRPNGELIYVTEPYGIDLRTLREMIEFADRHGLVFKIDARLSPHFPAATVAAIWRRRMAA